MKRELFVSGVCVVDTYNSFGRLNPQRSGHLERKIIKAWLLWFLDQWSTFTSFTIDQVEFFL